MKKVSVLLCGFAFLLLGSQGYAQILSDEKVVLVSNLSEMGLTVKEDMDRSTNGCFRFKFSMVTLIDNNVYFTAITPEVSRISIKR